MNREDQMKKITVCAVCALAACSCSTSDVTAVANQLGLDLAPETATLVAVHYNQPADCNAAIARVWPARLQAWARKVVWRESRNNPAAKNKRSSASGCFQLLAMHADLFAATGSSWAARFDPLANTQAAYALYQGSGTSPWRATR